MLFGDKILYTLPLLLLWFPKIHVLDNGLALSPPMGWMSWGYYMCEVDCENNPGKCLNEDLILTVADEFFMNSYQEAGYQYIIIDDCWSEMSRDANGRLVPDHKRFPNGMKYIADYIHARGLKFGLYTSAGNITCKGYPGSREYLKIDADTFAMWDVDYVKFDGCFVEEDFLNRVYIEFGNYLNKTGRPMVYSCSWPYYIEYIYHHMPNYTAVSEHCNLWRNFHDIFYNWPSVRSIVEHYQKQYKRMAKYMGPGKWNDPDMLVVGTGSTSEGQGRIQLVVYAMLSAPLLLSCDLELVSDAEKKLLLNSELIAIDQDPLGIQAVPHQLTPSQTLWIKRQLPMKGDQCHTYSMAFVNLHGDSGEFAFTPKQYGLNCSDGYSVMDVLSKTFMRNVTLEDRIEVSIPSEDVVLYKLFPL